MSDDEIAFEDHFSTPLDIGYFITPSAQEEKLRRSVRSLATSSASLSSSQSVSRLSQSSHQHEKQFIRLDEENWQISDNVKNWSLERAFVIPDPESEYFNITKIPAINVGSKILVFGAVCY